ncbi:hypothetical protein GCM10007216_18470 [Thalassobacillus devorans]|uniref:Uncharacterized protein n=1 Tax=Thalassobacillus devorans TaxID=279813 RepID=A0ABQ1P366_9BACI|nr:recombinase family protein [Thalassobacillus devorans]NIK28210.1 hypothetical protein [Thalassobacillus devorans]GGC88038.1 hypothetical protein GCM10007216_18470 [Thalassobacillus devorans]
MENVFCYYRKSIEFGNSWSPVQRIVHQEKVLLNYCEMKNLSVLKRFSDLGYLGPPFPRSELLQMRRTLEKPKYDVNLMVLYSFEALNDDIRRNDALLLEVVKQIGNVYFFKENLIMDYVRFSYYLEGSKVNGKKKYRYSKRRLG